MLFPGWISRLYTALVGGDLVAKEAEDGTLRMILPARVAIPAFVEMVGGAIFRLLGPGFGCLRRPPASGFRGRAICSDARVWYFQR